MTNAIEAGDHLRAAIAEIKNKDFNLRHWEKYARATMRHLWLTDCRSLMDKLHNPTPSAGEDKRLEIDILSLHEPLWFDREGQQKDHMEDDPEDDRIRWIDTSTMIADPLTKNGPKGFSDRLIEAYQTGIINFLPTEESTMRKLKASKARSKRVKASESDPVGTQEEPEEWYDT